MPAAVALTFGTMMLTVGYMERVLNKKINLVADGFIDSFDIIQIIIEIEKINKKKINMAKVNREAFSSVNNILKFFK